MIPTLHVPKLSASSLANHSLLVFCSSPALVFPSPISLIFGTTLYILTSSATFFSLLLLLLLPASEAALLLASIRPKLNFVLDLELLEEDPLSLRCEDIVPNRRGERRDRSGRKAGRDAHITATEHSIMDQRDVSVLSHDGSIAKPKSDNIRRRRIEVIHVLLKTRKYCTV